MIGVELNVDGTEIYKKCLEKGLLINCTQAKVLRIMPPLVVKKADIDQAISILAGVFKEIKL